MKSPFPGMDPYLEQSWGDIHTRLVASSSTALNKVLPDDLVARVEERVGIENKPGGGSRSRRSTVIPDARVFEPVGGNRVCSADAANVILAPFRLELLDEPETERFIEIVDVGRGGRLITVLEFVSPSNKSGDGIRRFIKKRNKLAAGGVNFVEIDLVRAGKWRRLLGPYAMPTGGVTAYRAVFRITEDADGVYLHPIALREPLPAVKVPLRTGEAPCELPLQR